MMLWYFGNPTIYARQYAAELCSTKDNVTATTVANCRKSYKLDPLKDDCNKCIALRAQLIFDASVSCANIGAKDNTCLEDRQKIIDLTQSSSGCMYDVEVAKYLVAVPSLVERSLIAYAGVIPTSPATETTVVGNLCSSADKNMILSVSWGTWFSVQNCILDKSREGSVEADQVKICRNDNRLTSVTTSCDKCLAYAADLRDTCWKICLDKPDETNCKACKETLGDYFTKDPFLMCFGAKLNTRAYEVIKKTKSANMAATFTIALMITMMLL
jgi:hypothetical protein